MGDFGIGQPVAREEDPYLVRGAGRYLDDVKLPGELRAFVLRSPHSHARIQAIDTNAAKAMPGVALILTGEDADIRKLGAQRPRHKRKRRDGSDGHVSPQPMLAQGHVRYIGDPVALIVAETLNQAKDAAEAIAVDYESLPAVTDIARAVKPGAPAVWPDCPDNQAFLHELGDSAAVERAMAAAAHMVRQRLVISRLTTNSMEPRGALAEFDARERRITLRCTVQSPHVIRRTLAQEILKIPETALRVISENVGGGFGMKGAFYPEYALVAVAARLAGRPVKWMSDRSEAILSDEHCRDNVSEAELALDKDGRFLALRVRSLGNLGAYHSSDRNAGPPTNNLGVLAGTYVLPAIHVEVTGTMTHTMLTGHYRGAGRPEAAYVLETMVDLAARELRIDPAELRRRNTIPAAAMPYKTALVYTYDCGDFGKNLADCLQKSDYENFEARRQASLLRGKLRGIGVSNTVAATNSGLIEHAELRFDQGGTLTLAIGTHDHGQGHGTSFRQIIADKLGIGPENVRFKYGDTDQVAIGTGTFGSRSMVAGGTALLTAADKIIAKGKKLAAHLMETAEHDILFERGQFTVAGTDKSVALAAVARAAFDLKNLPSGMEPGLYESGTFDGGDRTFPNGCHVCEVEIDRETGTLDIVRYSAVEDVGHMINPLLVAGQMHGGIAQGLGQAFLENIVYDSSGQLITGSFQDYCMPRADDLCAFDLGENEVPTKNNPLGVKGAGESGTVGGLSCSMNAINDALARIGAPPVAMPATPERLWRAMAAANGAAA